MDLPLPGMIHHLGPNLHKPLDERVYGRLDTLAPECRIPNHVEQIVGKTSDKKPCLIGCKPMATRLVPPECVLPLFDQVFNLSSTIVARDYPFYSAKCSGHSHSLPIGRFCDVSTYGSLILKSSEKWRAANDNL